MADKKFSEFPVVVNPTLTDIVVVGLDEFGQNAQFAGDEFGGGVSAHPALTDRDLPDQHPIDAITGLQTALDAKEPALGDPLVSGYVLSSTDTGTRSWVAQSGGGSALTIEAEGTPLTTAATLLNFEGAGVSVTEPIADEITITIPGSVPYGFIDAGDYILIVAIGDSYIEGFSAPEIGIAPAPNPNLYCWMMPTLTSSYVPADIEWVNNVNWDAPARTLQHNDAYADLRTFTGQYLGGACSPAAMYADAVQRATGKTVFLYQNAMGSMQTTVWLAPSGDGWNGYDSVWGAGNDGLAAAIAAMNVITGGSKTAADSMFCSLGTNDIFIGNIDGQTWYDDRWSVFYTQLVDSGWLDPATTQYVHMETSTNPGITDPAYVDGWPGFALMLANSNERITLLASAGAEPDSPTGIHFTAAQQIIFGNTACIRHLNGPSGASAARENTYVQTLAPVLNGPVTAPGALYFTSDMTPTVGLDRVFVWDTSSTFSGGDVIQEVRNNGTPILQLYGTGAFYVMDGAGSPKFRVDALGSTYFHQPVRLATGVTSIISEVAATSPAFLWNTSNTFGGGDPLYEVRNNGTTIMQLYGTGAFYVQDGAGNPKFRVDALGSTYLHQPVVLPLGTVTSTVAATGTAIGFKFTTPSYSSGDSIAKFFNAADLKLTIAHDGGFISQGGAVFAGAITTTAGAINTTLGTFNSLVASTGSASAFTFESAPGLTTGDKLATFKSYTANRLFIAEDGTIESAAVIKLRPTNTNASEYFAFGQFVNNGYLDWHPQDPTSASATFNFRNYKTHVTATAFSFMPNTTMTGGNIMEWRNSGLKASLNYLGAPGFWGVTPVTTQATAGIGSSGTFAGGGGTSATSTSTWTGGNGTTAYTVNDVVRALKDIGILVL